MTNSRDISLDNSQTSVKSRHFGVEVSQGGLNLGKDGRNGYLLPLKKSNGAGRRMMLPLRVRRSGMVKLLLPLSVRHGTC